MPKRCPSVPQDRLAVDPLPRHRRRFGVDILEPEHPLLDRPNTIGPEDWANWDKERGLYFASEWDKAYKPLLAMSGKGEDKLQGSLLSAEIGRGRHTSLVLHHQLDKLVPGAFRLLAIASAGVLRHLIG